MRPCDHRNRRIPFLAQGVLTVYCENPEVTRGKPEVRVPASQCDVCPPEVYGIEIDAKFLRKRRGERCRFRSDNPLRTIPCACPAISEFALWGCDKHEECVTSLDHLDRIPDSDDASGCQCCQRCPDWQPMQTGSEISGNSEPVSP